MKRPQPVAAPTAEAKRKKPEQFQQQQTASPLDRLAGELSRGESTSGRQDFGEQEHRSIGDEASREPGGKRSYITLGTKGYVISYGEMVAMADYFASLEQMERFANTPGPGPETQEALDYVRYVRVGKPLIDWDHDKIDQIIDSDDVLAAGEKDGRFEASTYSAATRKAVDENYYILAAKNSKHFVAPNGDRAAGPVAPGVAGESGPAHKRQDSAGSNYRENHEEAIRRAVYAGATGTSIDPALAAEGFGQHFLTDACSSGHVRTPRVAAQQWWDARDPGLFAKFKGYFSWRVSEHLMATTSLGRVPGVERLAMGQVGDAFAAAIAGKAELTMGMLVAVALHDYDNQEGLAVIADGKQAKIFGDGKLDDKGEADKDGILENVQTREIAATAARRGLDEIHLAYSLGAGKMSLPFIRDMLLGSTGNFAAERALPKLDETSNDQTAMPKWQVQTWQELFDDPTMVAAFETTITNQMKELEAIADAQPEPARTAIKLGFTKRVRDAPVAELRAILAYSGEGDSWADSRAIVKPGEAPF